jgi:hypothetical protein
MGNDVWFSVRADLMNTGEKQDMANRGVTQKSRRRLFRSSVR